MKITKQDEPLMSIIEQRTNWKNDTSYIGFDMSKTHSQSNIETTLRNIRILNLFQDYLDVFYIFQHFDCWKGVCFWTNEQIHNFDGYNYNVDSEVEFSGRSSKDILMWLIKNKGKYKREIKEENGEHT